MTFRTLTPADFESRPYSPPFTDIDDVLSSRPASPVPALHDADTFSDDLEMADQILVHTTYDHMLSMNKQPRAPRD